MSTMESLPILSFAAARSWEQWLVEHHANLHGVWIQVAKKASGIPSVNHEEALDVALCYGWIDGQRDRHDDRYFLQKFTPRQPTSRWSKRNTVKVARLIAEGRMQASGLVEVEAAKQDGRWAAAYNSPKDMVVPADFLKALEHNKQAQTFFNTLSKSQVYAISWQLETARKQVTRKRRFDTLLAMLERGEFH